MFERLPAPAHVLACRFSGTLTGEDLRHYRELLDGVLAQPERIGACIDFTGLSDMDADAFIEGARADMELLGHVGRFGRIAFVSAKQWPQALIGLARPILPMVEMKVVGPDEVDAAIEWAAKPSQTRGASAAAIRFVPTTKNDVLAFEIDGVISAEEIPGLVRRLDDFLESHEKVRLLGRIRHLGGFDPRVLMQGGLVSMKLAAMQKVERYAIVGAPAWMQKIVETMNPAFPDIDMRTFPADREADAWAWLGAEPTG